MLKKSGILLISTLCIVSWAGCDAFQNEQESIFECTETDLSNAVLHVGVNISPNSRIEAYNPETFEKLYEIGVPRGSPFHFDYNTKDEFFYSIDLTAEESAIYHRRIRDGGLIDSVITPLADFRRMNDSTFITHITQVSSFIIIDKEIKREGFSEDVVQPVQQIRDEHYTIYRDRNFENIYFGKVDTAGFTLVKDITEIIQSTIVNSAALSLYYVKEENRLLVTLINAPLNPNSVLFDIDLNTEEFTATAVGQGVRIIPSDDPRYLFLTHRGGFFNLNSRPTQYFFVYDKEDKEMLPLFNLEQRFGNKTFIRDITTSGCTMYAAIDAKGGDKIVEYDMKTNTITKELFIESITRVQTLKLSTNQNQ